MKHFYLIIIVGLIFASQLHAQNYWLEFKVNDDTKYYPVAEIQKIDFSDVSTINSQIVLHFLDSTNIAFPLKNIKDVQFTEDTTKKEYKIILALNDNTQSTLEFDKIYKLEITTPSAVGEEIAFVNISDNYPNPFQNNTTIEFSLLIDCHVEIVVYDLFGNLIKSIDNSLYSKGKHSVAWDGKSADGSDITPGVYYCTIRSDKGAIINKMLKVR